MGMLGRWLAAGERQLGWKLAFTGAGARKMMGSDGPGFGYLLERGRAASGASYVAAEMTTPLLEVELAITLGGDLTGPDVTREQVVAQLATIAPSFEVLERRGDMAADLPLGIADNILQSGVVLGEPIAPSAGLDLGAMTVEIFKGGQLEKSMLAREVIDEQFRSVAWLANQLAPFGQGLKAGQVIMSGSFVPPFPVEAGEAWEARLAGVGAVTVQIT